MQIFDRLSFRNSKATKRLAEEIEILHKSPLVDPVWYRRTYCDVRDTPIDVARHYLEHGAAEGRNPHPLFDTNFYLEQNPDVVADGANPLVHYITYGAKEGRDPHRLFDTQWYLGQIPDPLRSEVNALAHYLTEGWRQELSPHPEIKGNSYSEENRRLSGQAGNAPAEFVEALTAKGIATFCRAVKTAASAVLETGNSAALEMEESGEQREARLSDNFALSSAPFVSIIITNLNGARHLPELFDSLKSQTYRNFEIIFVDDNSTDGSADIARRLGASVVVVTEETVGFAKANNIALDECRGELIALLNNDTRADPNWLESLVLEMRRDNCVCAVAPKIRFWRQFQRLRFQAQSAFSVNRAALLDSLGYKKFFVRTGEEFSDSFRSLHTASAFILEIDLPIQDAPFRASLSSGVAQAVSLRIGLLHRTLIVRQGETAVDIVLDGTAKRSGFHIINNVGSMEYSPLRPRDRGFGEVDEAQYDRVADVDLFCGCSVLLRRDSLHGRGLFIDEFVAYYEDSELSKWLREKDYTIRYCPSAIVYHQHSATTVEKSLFWRVNVHKNAILFEYIFSDKPTRPDIIAKGRAHLNHLRHYYINSPESTTLEREFSASIPALCADIDALVSLVDRGEVPRRARPRIGLYNSFWNTMGGGEAHALDVAGVLCQYGQVELISEDDFDLLSICTYFNVDLPNARKRLVKGMDTAITGEYDIFVNARYQSQLVSHAKHSFFVVSFPSKTPSKAFLNSYYFLANSEYTMRWMERMWSIGPFSGEVFYPAVPTEMMIDADTHPPKKKKLILSVGRFAADGHTKNQLEIALAFKYLCDMHPSVAEGWTLVLVGSTSDDRYISQVQSAIQNLDVKIILNASFEVVRECYRDAAVYVHASGYGRDATTSPELFEHFGMAVAQAVGSGCVPIVFGAAGPEEIVRKIGGGHVFYSVDDLVRLLVEILPTFDSQADAEQMVVTLAAKARMFSKELQRRQLVGLFDKALHSI